MKASLLRYYKNMKNAAKLMQCEPFQHNFLV